MATILEKYEEAVASGQPIGLQEHNLRVVAKRFSCQQDIDRYVKRVGRDGASNEPGVYWHNEGEKGDMLQACNIARKAYEQGLVKPMPDHQTPDVICFGCHNNSCLLQERVDRMRERNLLSEALQRMKEKK